MTTTSQADVLDQIFAGLKSKVYEARLASAIELQRYVRTCPTAYMSAFTNYRMRYHTGLEYHTRDYVGRCG